MDGILKALGFDSKPEYKDKIPDKLTSELFKVHNTFKHGFTSLPLCLGYDSVQQLLAIGTETGSVLLLGKPGLERHIEHPTKVAVTHMEFITNKGQLVTSCDNNTLYLWDLREKEPVILHSAEFMSEKPTALSHVFGSDWLYVGTGAGNVHLVNVFTFKVSGFSIHWNNAVELSCRHKPGDVISVQEHPLDQGKVLIAFSGGKCVLYDMKIRSEGGNLAMSQKDFRGDGHKRFNYDPGSDHILTCVSWLGNGKNFACSYSDGTIVLWNPKSEVKPEKIFPLHDVDPSAFKPIYKMQQVNTEGDPWIVASGGYPEGNDLAPRTLTILCGKNPPRMLSSESTILDFLCLPSSPYASDCQKPFALVMLTKNELILHDLEQPEFPRYPNYLFPNALDIHLPGVTSLRYTANCPDEFVASLHSVKSKIMKTSAKPWPLKGGKWGQEVPHTSTDLIVTGHVDGSVRLWYCSSVILQPFFTMSTSQYFEMQYQPSPSETPSTSPVKRLTKSLKKSSPGSTPPSLKTTPTTTPSPTKTAHINKTVPPERPPPPKGPPPKRPPPPLVTTEHPSPSHKVEETETLAAGDKKDEEIKVPYPATGEQQTLSPSDSTDGLTSLDKGLRPQNSPGDSSKPFSHERKSLFKKKSKKTKNGGSPHSSRGPSPTPDETAGAALKTSEDKPGKKSPLFLKKSFKKVAKAVKIGRSISRDKEKRSVDQVDGELSGSGASETLPTEEGNKEEEDVQAQRRPDVLPLHAEKHSPPREEATLSAQHLSPSKTPATITTEQSKPLSMKVTTPGAANAVKQSPRGASQANKPPPLKTTTPVASASNTVMHSPVSSPSVHTDDFFPIGNIDLCVMGLWMCVSNKGGTVLAFNFQMAEQDKQPQAIDINFDSDSVLRQYKHTSARSPPPPSEPEVGQYSFTHRTVEHKPGFQLAQVCSCFYRVHPKKALKSDPKVRVPAKISVLKYSVDLGLLVIGTNRGLALVDTSTNTCLYVLSTLTSILYLSDPSKFTRQMRKESETQLQLPKPLIKRHSTHRALSAAVTPTGKKPPRTRYSSPAVVVQGLPEDPLEDDCFDDKEMTVSELECSVTALELVQLQLDKQVSPTLTLWVGVVSGRLVAYGVNVVKKESSRKIDLIPTKFIQENKSPIVQVYFLNSWGDHQLIPYQPKRTNLTGSPQSEAPRAKGSNGALEHYAIVVSEDKIKSYSFPGCLKIETCSVDLPDGCAILQSEYFKCDDLPCLLSVASNKSIFIHSLPGLRQLLHIPFNALSDTRAICTFRVSGHGQGIFMTSDSEFQRLSVLKDDRLNLPACLPSLYVKMADPEHYHGGMGKRILDALFTTGGATIDREQLFGSAARRPVGNLYKLDGKVASSYGGKRDREREEQRLRGGGAEGTSHGRAGGLAGQMNRNVHALNERKEKLSAIEERTEAVAQHASDFAEMAKKLRQKYEH